MPAAFSCAPDGVAVWQPVQTWLHKFAPVLMTGVTMIAEEAAPAPAAFVAVTVQV